MHLRYVHYFGNESNESILEAYGLKPHTVDIDKMKPVQCPNCKEPNQVDSKFCVKCRLVLSYDAYQETVQEKDSMKNEMDAFRKEMEHMKTNMINQVLEATRDRMEAKNIDTEIPTEAELSNSYDLHKRLGHSEQYWMPTPGDLVDPNDGLPRCPECREIIVSRKKHIARIHNLEVDDLGK